jgi:hypothetical protein
MPSIMVVMRGYTVTKVCSTRVSNLHQLPLLRRSLPLPVPRFLSFAGSLPTCPSLVCSRTAARLGNGSLGAYVISMSQAASDVLAVELLQKEARLMVGTRLDGSSSGSYRSSS